jgi:SNF family Na+-dependent transporter
MTWLQEWILLLTIAVIGLGIIHGIEKIARILDYHFNRDRS